MLGILLAVILLSIGYTKRASGNSEQIEVEPIPTPKMYGMASVTANPILPTSEPSPEPTTAPVAHEKVKQVASPIPAPKKLAMAKTTKLRSSISRFNCSANPKAAGCCVDVLKLDGDLPDQQVTKDGFARSIPSKKIEKFIPGQEMVIKTKESVMGHVLKVKINEEGQAVSIKEGGHPDGVGRIVNPAVIVGEVKL